MKNSVIVVKKLVKQIKDKEKRRKRFKGALRIHSQSKV